MINSDINRRIMPRKCREKNIYTKSANLNFRPGIADLKFCLPKERLNIIEKQSKLEIMFMKFKTDNSYNT